MEIQEDKEFVVAGFRFQSEEEASLAEKERNRIEFLKTKFRLKEKDTAQQVYLKLLEEKVFHTPVGYSFLKNLQSFLKSEGEQVKPIPVEHEVIKTVVPLKSVKKAQKKKEKNYKQGWITSILVNIILILAVTAMFFILQSGNNVNILNYKTKLINQYEEWEQELKLREEHLNEMDQQAE